MIPTDDLRRVLEGKAIAAANAIGMAGKIKMPNNDFVQPKSEPWLNFWFKTGGSRRLEIGGGTKVLTRTVGLIHCDIMVPERTGDGEISRLAGDFARRFSNKEWQVPPYGSITMDIASVKTPFGTDAVNGWFRYIADATFNFDYRDLEALPIDA